MITLDGIALSPGVARGTVVTVRPPAAPTRPREDHRGARAQFADARRRAEAELRRAFDALPGIDGPARQILRAHLSLVADPALVGEVESRIDGDRLTALDALERAAAALVSRFEALGDPVLRSRAADLRDVCDCIARHLVGETPAADPVAPEPRVVCATDLTPAQVLKLALDRPLAFVLERGAETSHAAILMRALAIPAVIGVPRAMALVEDGDLVVVDGDRGQVVVRPNENASDRGPAPDVMTALESDPEPAATRDGVTIAVTASIGDAADARRAIAAGADGIGLFRTESLFLRSDRLPSEDAQCASYRDVFDAVGSRPLTLRLLDLGADKQPAALQLPHEPNPALGLRGVRLSLVRPDLLMTQLRALLRAADGRRLRLLLPMVVDTADLARVREFIEEASRGIPSGPPNIEVGAMVETPAAALTAEELVQAADFLSIGTNDLAQYVLAADRDSAPMAPYYQPLHPAVLRLVRDVVAAARRQGKPVSICGETAADPLAIPLFIGMGVTELSVHPSAIARVKAQVRRCMSDV